MPKSMTKFVAFSRVDFVGFWCVSGCMFVTVFDVFSGLATTDREKPGYVKFVDRIEKLTDFQENQGRDFRKKTCKNHVLEYVVFPVTFRASFLSFLGSF